jgi:uncharacterized protein YaeQ
MALKPTIFKFTVAISDLNQHVYETVPLTVAQHPSETLERMMARLMAYCLHVADDPEQRMTFTTGLSTPDEPDIWLRGLNDVLELSIDMGEPSAERAKKASRLTQRAYIYTFNSKSDVWWRQSEAELSQLPINVIQFDWSQIQALSTALSRTMSLSLTITEQSIYVAFPDSQCEVHWNVLQSVN